jgi:hypothetical protein
LSSIVHRLQDTIEVRADLFERHCVDFVEQIGRRGGKTGKSPAFRRWQHEVVALHRDRRGRRVLRKI